jgi:hypothetical protein
VHRVRLEHQLRVPLHAENGAIGSVDDGFDQSIGREGYRHERWGKFPNCLMVKRVDAEAVAVEDREQTRISRGNRVTDGVLLQSAFVLTVADSRRSRVLGRDVLDQRAPKGDVHDLNTAADAEDRNASLSGGMKQVQLKLIAF